MSVYDMPSESFEENEKGHPLSEGTEGATHFL